MQRAASTSKLLSTKISAIDPFLYNDSTHVVEEGLGSSNQPHLLRSAEVRTPTPPRQLLRSSILQHSKSDKLSPRAEAAASALEEALDIATAPGRAKIPLKDDEYKDDASSCSLSVCSQIYSDVED